MTPVEETEGIRRMPGVPPPACRGPDGAIYDVGRSGVVFSGIAFVLDEGLVASEAESKDSQGTVVNKKAVLQNVPADEGLDALDHQLRFGHRYVAHC